MEPGRPDRLTLAAFAGLVVLGGLNALGIRFSNRGLPPFWGAGLRFGLASLLFFGIVRLRRVPLPRGRALLGAATFGALVFGIGFALGYWALVWIHAGTGQVLLASAPLLTFFLALAHRQERFRWHSVAGGVLAIAGIAVIFAPQAGGALPVVAVAAVLGTSLCLSEATVLAKSFPAVPPAAMNAVAMGVGAVMLVGTSLVAGERIGLPTEPVSWLALGYLVVVGSLGVFLLFLFVLRRWTASATSYEFVLFPLVTLPLSAWLDGEPLTLVLLAGGALVLGGVYVGALMSWPRREAAPGPEARLAVTGCAAAAPAPPD
ncbi:MAG TPA: EamA family transporter [Actinomycetota bacterium]|nr:EamA family transporter [Actinomycetota bacterium]